MFDLINMEENELKTLSNMISEELYKRDRQNREKLWTDLVNTFYAYTKKYGSVDFYDGNDTWYIDFDDFCFDNIGEICAKD